MSASEFAEWVAFYLEEPFGDARADLRAGVVAMTVAKTMGRKGMRYTPLDFMPIVKAQREKDMGGRGRTAEMRQAFEGNLGTMVKFTRIKKG